MSEITTQIEVRLNQLGVKIEKKDIEIRIEKLINEFKVPPEEAKQTLVNYFLIRHKKSNANFVPKQDAQKVKVSEIKLNGKWVTLRCKVVKLLDTHHESIDQDGFLGDESGTIKFTKWAKSNLPQLIEGDNYLFENVITSEYQEQFSIKLNKNSKIIPINEHIDVGKFSENPSEKEKWYLERTKNLRDLGHFNECIDLCNEAISTLPSQNTIWLKYLRAKIKGKLGQRDGAIIELKELLKLKNEWFIQKQIAHFCFENGQVDEALKYAIDSTLNSGRFEDKLNLFYLIGSILKSQSKLDYAKKHILFSIKICEEQHKKYPDELQEAILEFNVEAPPLKSSSELHKELRQYWNSVKLANLPKNQGVIKTILPNGKAGFISGDNGKDYYFRLRSFLGSQKQIMKGLRVIFYIENSFDPVKKQDSYQAINIEVNKLPMEL